MKFNRLFQQPKRIFSFEFFPPRSPEGEDQLYHVLEDLRPLQPDFVSVTYGAMGTHQDKTLSIVGKIKNEIGLEVTSHFTCIGLTEEKVDAYLASLENLGIENVLALRGDVPAGMPRELALQGAYQHANQLVESLRKKKKDLFGIAVAGYPEGHVESKDLLSDVEYLKRKVDAGADVVITQLFYDNADFYKFRDLAKARGITVPILPGIMPIQNIKQIEKITTLCGARIPEPIRAFYRQSNLSTYAQEQFGIDYATQQCLDLLKNEAKGIHFYTLNKSLATRKIFLNLSAYH